jgi:S-ribosylhomocysteine lyase
MGCRTGFYLILVGDLASADILPLLKEMSDFIAGFQGEIPGYSPRDCGNYLDNNLSMAKYYMAKFDSEVLANPVKERLNYPE